MVEIEGCQPAVKLGSPNISVNTSFNVEEIVPLLPVRNEQAVKTAGAGVIVNKRKQSILKTRAYLHHSLARFSSNHRISMAAASSCHSVYALAVEQEERQKRGIVELG